LALGKTPKRLLKVSGKHFGSQKQANIRNRTPAIPSVRTAFRRDEDLQDNIADNRYEIPTAEAPILYVLAARRKTSTATVLGG
jgi:hypothetical protein